MYKNKKSVEFYMISFAHMILS